jgi:hypothetical protein
MALSFATTIGIGAALCTLDPILIAGEWKGVSPRSKFVFWGGLFLLGSAILAITYGN